MLTLYKARTVYSGADRVLEEIGNIAGRHVVIAPDAFTLAVEQTIAAKLGRKGVFDVEVMSFARLATVLLGSEIKKCLSPSGSVMLMEKVVREEEDSLRYYRRVARKAGFASEMYAAITSIRNSGVSAERLALAEEHLRGYVRDKTHDVALLYGAYLAELNLRHTDGTSRLEALVREIENREDLGDVSFHVVDHVDLNAKQVEVVAALMRRARSVSVAVAVGGGEDNQRIYPKLREKLCRVAERQGVPVREVEVASTLSGARETISRELFSYSFESGRAERLTLAEAKDRAEEVSYLATEITRLVREEGLRYSDVAVITPSFKEYLPHMERIFDHYGIPLFSDARYSLAESDLFRHVVNAMEIPVGRYSAPLLRKYISHALFSAVSSEDKAAFCDYADMSGADRDRFRSPFLLFREDPLYEGAERTRAALFEEIGSLCALPVRATVGAYVAALKDFLREKDFDGKIELYVKAVRDAGLLKQAEIVRQTPAALMTLLDTLEDLRGGEPVSYADFILALSSGAEQVKIAALPVSLDCVYFAPVEQAMYAPIGALFVIGAEEGLFPLERTKEGVLGPTEYAAWQTDGIEIENTDKDALAAGRFHALQLLLRGERLTLSHLESRVASPCMTQLSEIFGADIVRCEELLKGYPIEILIPTRLVAEEKLVEYSRRAREGLSDERETAVARSVARALGKEFPLPYEEDAPVTLSKELARKVFFRKGTVSPTELESYFSCPFSHFVRFGLEAKEKDVAGMDKRYTGNLAHECMERFVRDYLSKESATSMPDEEAVRLGETLAREAIERDPHYRVVREKEGERYIEREVRRCGRIAVVVKNQIAASSFRPALFEASFGGSGRNGLTTVSLDGVPLKGRIDRVDLLPEEVLGDGRRYAVALDYKTGSNKIKASDLYFGKKVQLPLYLNVLSASGYDPIAALYASLSDAREKSPKFFVGPKLNNEALMKCLDGAIGETRSPYTGIIVKKDGLSENESLLVSKAEFDAFPNYAEAVSAQAVGEIRDGYIRPTPLKDGQNVCEYCDFHAICRHAKENAREKGNVSPEELRNITEGVDDD